MYMANVLLFLSLFVLCAASQNEGPVLNSSNATVVYRKVGSSVTLSCATTAVTNGIVWYFNNEPLTTGAVEVQQGSLTFSSLTLTDGGWYTCTADNDFWRGEKDFLLVVGVPSTEVITFKESIYQVPSNSRVELPCHFTGVPHPTIRWFEGSGSEITITDERYAIDNLTKSLIIRGSGQERTLTFYCLAQNMFDEAAQRRNVTVEFFNVGQLNETISFPLNERGPESLVVSGVGENLMCINVPDLTNYTVEWTMNLDPSTAAEGNVFAVRQSGYYCCQVTGPDLRRSFFCITVVNRDNSVPDLSMSSISNISLPANSSRTVNLICSGSTQSAFAPPTIEWSSQSGNAASSNVSSGLRYLVDVDSTGCSTPHCSTSFTCSGANFAGQDSAAVTVNSVALCPGDNVLRGGSANLSTSDGWTASVSGAARVESVRGEWVFVLEYNDTSIPSFSQTVDMPDNVLFIDVSGRVRQEGSDNFEATVKLLVDNIDLSNECLYLTHPYPTLQSWQAIGCHIPGKLGSNLTIVMTAQMRGLPSQGGASGVAYFDDLCVTFDVKTVEDESGLTDLQKYAIIAGGGACGALLVLILMVLCCFCCCCNGKRKRNAKMMKKMSTLIKKKRVPPQVAHELQGTDGHFTSQPEAQQLPVEPDMYVAVESQEQDAYINPDNYAYCVKQQPVKVPPVIVEQPNQSSTPSVAIPSTTDDSSNQINGLYTSLKRGEMDQNNLYMTPSNCSTSSLPKLVENEDRGYINVDEETSAKYLTLVSPSSHKSDEFMRSSPSVGRRSPSPSYPPPPPPAKRQAKGNGRGLSPSASGPIRRYSADETHSTNPPVPSQTLEASEQQIYENSQEIVTSTSPLFNGALRNTSGSSDRLLPGVSVSPPAPETTSQVNKIYENSQEFFMLEDSDEDDIYENDLPGMNQQES